MSKFGVKVSVPGDDVKTTDTPNYDATDSIYNLYLNGLVTVYSNGTSVTVTIPHNLGYTPAVEAYYIWHGQYIGTGTPFYDYSMKNAYMGSFGFIINNGDIILDVDNANITFHCYDQISYGPISPANERYWDIKYTIAYNKIA
jgi:hypothetical protein